MTMRWRLAVVAAWLALGLLPAAPAWADTSYIIQPGDTLTKIANRFNVSVDALIRANNLADPNKIQVGQTLVIPDGAASAPSAPGGTQVYIVQRGDSLSRIAARYKVTIDALVTANNLTTSTLQPGQQLVIPSTAPAPANAIAQRVHGEAAFTRRVLAALDWLQAHDADAFARVETYVTQITASPYRNLALARPLGEGGCLVRALARPGMSTPMIAALLFHEATHCYQFATAGMLSDKEAEVFAYSEQLAFMRRHGFTADEIAYYEEVLAYYQAQPDDGRDIPPPAF